jgi:hypothetical protein
MALMIFAGGGADPNLEGRAARTRAGHIPGSS